MKYPGMGISHMQHEEKEIGQGNQSVKWTQILDHWTGGYLLRLSRFSTGPDSCQLDLGRGPVVQALMGTPRVGRPEVEPRSNSDFKYMITLFNMGISYLIALHNHSSKSGVPPPASAGPARRLPPGRLWACAQDTHWAQLDHSAGPDRHGPSPLSSRNSRLDRPRPGSDSPGTDGGDPHRRIRSRPSSPTPAQKLAHNSIYRYLRI
jgi:hypothetical protein